MSIAISLFGFTFWFQIGRTAGAETEEEAEGPARSLTDGTAGTVERSHRLGFQSADDPIFREVEHY